MVAKINLQLKCINKSKILKQLLNIDMLRGAIYKEYAVDISDIYDETVMAYVREESSADIEIQYNAFNESMQARKALEKNRMI